MPPFAQDNNNSWFLTATLDKNQNNCHFQQAANALNTCFLSETFLTWSTTRTPCAPSVSNYRRFPPLDAQETIPALPTTKSLPFAFSYVQDGILLTGLPVIRETEITRLKGSRCLLSLSPYIPDGLPSCQEKKTKTVGGLLVALCGPPIVKKRGLRRCRHRPRTYAKSQRA